MTDQAPEPSRPAGTVYGAGADITKGTPSGLPRAVPIVVGAGAIAVLLLGYAAWSSTGGADKAPAPAVAATAPGTTPATEAANPSPAPAQLSPGSWLLSPLGDPATYLTVNDEFAKMSPADPATLTVVAGLADDTCFSFQLEDGRYLRHFDYRLRFDADDDSEVFRGDATFCREAGTDPGTVRLRSKNYPDHLLHHRDDDSVYIDEPAEKTGFDFMVQPPA